MMLRVLIVRKRRSWVWIIDELDIFGRARTPEQARDDAAAVAHARFAWLFGPMRFKYERAAI